MWWCHDRFGRFFFVVLQRSRNKNNENSPDKTIVMSSTRAPRFNNLRWGKLFAFHFVTQPFCFSKNWKSDEREHFCMRKRCDEIWRRQTRLYMVIESSIKSYFFRSCKDHIFHTSKLHPTVGYVTTRLSSIIASFKAPIFLFSCRCWDASCGKREQATDGIKNLCAVLECVDEQLCEDIRKEQTF